MIWSGAIGVILVCSDNRFKLVFVQDGDIPLLCFGEFTAGVLPGNQIVGLPRDTTDGTTSVEFDQAVDFSSGTRQCARYDKYLSCQFAAG